MFEENSVDSKKIDWETFGKEVFAKASISRDSAILKALELNNNPHTFYLRHGKYIHAGKRNVLPDTNSWILCEDINIKKLFREYGYINVPGLTTDPSQSARNKGAARDFINAISDSVLAEDQRRLKGWIIDLRENTGGNMWPMLVALAPLLPDGTLGFFKGSRKTIKWHKKDGQIWYDQISQTKQYRDSLINYTLLNKNLRIAVLIGGRTVSAGEAVAISFKSVPEVRFFGQKTYGFATANQSIPMGNGEFLVITTSHEADKTGTLYPNGIEPDVITNCNLLEKELRKFFED